MFQDEDIGKLINQVFNWLMWLAIFAVEAHSFARNSLRFIQFAQFLLLIRNLLPMFDLDGKRFDE